MGRCVAPRSCRGALKEGCPHEPVTVDTTQAPIADQSLAAVTQVRVSGTPTEDAEEMTFTLTSDEVMVSLGPSVAPPYIPAVTKLAEDANPDKLTVQGSFIEALLKAIGATSRRLRGRTGVVGRGAVDDPVPCFGKAVRVGHVRKRRRKLLRRRAAEPPLRLSAHAFSRSMPCLMPRSMPRCRISASHRSILFASTALASSYSPDRGQPYAQLPSHGAKPQVERPGQLRLLFRGEPLAQLPYPLGQRPGVHALLDFRHPR